MAFAKPRGGGEGGGGEGGGGEGGGGDGGGGDGATKGSDVSVAAVSIEPTVTPREVVRSVVVLPAKAARAVFPAFSSGAMSSALTFTEPAAKVRIT